MGDRPCAVCGGGADPLWTRPVPADWEAYLIAERGLDPDAATPDLSLCPACGPDVNHLIRELEHADQYTDAERTRLVVRRNELLDGLRLDALVPPD